MLMLPLLPSYHPAVAACPDLTFRARMDVVARNVRLIAATNLNNSKAG